MEARIYVNPDWTFKETISMIKALKQNYYGALTLFKCFDIHEKVELIRRFKQDIYNLHFEEWKRDRIWDYLNDNIELEEFNKYVQLDSFK